MFKSRQRLLEYARDLAYVHDVGFGDLAQAAARMVQELRPPGAILDLGCGSGLLLEELANWHLIGIDISPDMIALAKRRVPRAKLQIADAWVHLEDADVITAVGEVMNYGGNQDLPAWCKRVHTHLAPGGLLLFDVATLRRAGTPTKAVRVGKNWRVEATAQEERGVLTRTIDTFVDERHSREIHTLTLWDEHEVEAALAAAGFSVEVLAGYDDFAFMPGWVGFAATKS